jgi:hypothetical protein
MVVLFTSVTSGGLAQAQQPAPEAAPRISVAHFAPFIDTIPRSRVEVRVDGQPVGNVIYYLNAITNLELTPGTHDLDLLPLDWPGKDVAESVDAVEDTDVIYALIGGTGDVGPQVVSYPNETASDPVSALVRLHNFAPVAFDGDTEITLCNENDEPFLDVDNLRFPDSSTYVTATPGVYVLHISPTSKDCQDPAVEDFEVALDAGQIVDLYFTGLTDSEVFPLSVVQYDEGLRRRWPHVAYLPTILAVN